MAYRLDNIPPLLRPVHLVASWIVGTFFVFSYYLIRLTTRVEYIGREKAEALPNAIYCVWHDNWLPYFIYFPRHRNHVWMCHSAWYMKHILVIMWWAGVREAVLGSTGDKGREAADRILEKLKEGKSTVMAPDGPYGPKRQLKKGALHLAQQSGVPLIALEFQISRAWIIPGTWEGKKYPLPFSRTKIIFHPPLYVTEAGFAQSGAQLAKQLG